MRNAFNGIATDEECFNAELGGGVHLDNFGYVELFKQCAQAIKEKCGGSTFVDLGGGMGAYSLNMKRLGYDVTYIDASKHHFDYVKARNAADTYHIGDFTKTTFTQDIAGFIEVAEHIEDERLLPFLKDFLKTDWLHFSSTPERNGNDKNWGHINIKPTDTWISTIESSGWTLVDCIAMPTAWSLLFKRNK